MAIEDGKVGDEPMGKKPRLNNLKDDGNKAQKPLDAAALKEDKKLKDADDRLTD